MSKKQNRFAFPAILHYADDGISVEFPDLPGCLSCSTTTEEALVDAKEALGLHLWGMDQDGEEIPKATPVNNLKIQPNEIPVLIEVFMPPVRDRIENRFTKKTLSIPQWLNFIIALPFSPWSLKRNGLFFSLKRVYNNVKSKILSL